MLRGHMLRGHMLRGHKVRGHMLHGHMLRGHMLGGHMLYAASVDHLDCWIQKLLGCFAGIFFFLKFCFLIVFF